MRVASVLALAVAVLLSMFARRSEAAGLHHLAVEDDDDFRPQYHPYRDYALMRRSARADDAFDDYGHLRFGRSDD
ncbi:hypothetical protein NE865_06223 [Phthorimaea operculella]|nr:hypothetical protein NE865_06223 [Phthorimaea operculella]